MSNQAEQPDAECVAYTPTPVVMELGPETLDPILNVLREGFALVAAASNEAHEESYVPTWLVKSARTLAAAMTPGEGEKEKWATGYCSAHQTPDPLCRLCNPRIQELEAERDRAVDKMTECGVEACRERDQRLTAATKLLERGRPAFGSQEHGYDIDAWLKGQPEAATPPLDKSGRKLLHDFVRIMEESDEDAWNQLKDLEGVAGTYLADNPATPPFNAEKVAWGCAQRLCGSNDDAIISQDAIAVAVADEIRKEQGEGEPWDGSRVKADTELAAAREANRELQQRIQELEEKLRTVELNRATLLRQHWHRIPTDDDDGVTNKQWAADLDMQVQELEAERDRAVSSEGHLHRGIESRDQKVASLNQRIAAARARLESRVDEIETRLAEIDKADLPGIMRRAAKARAKTQTQLENLSDNTAAHVNATVAELERLREAEEPHLYACDQCEREWVAHPENEGEPCPFCELERLRGGLPKTADGVAVTPGMDLYMPGYPGGAGEANDMTVNDMRDWPDVPEHDKRYVRFGETQRDFSTLYSTREAAEQAKEQGDE